LDPNHAKQMERIRVLRLARQDFSIQRFGLIQVAGLVKPHGGLKNPIIHFRIRQSEARVDGSPRSNRIFREVASAAGARSLA
jgi:hypothetical protein